MLQTVHLFWMPFEERILVISHQEMFPLMIHFLLTLKGLLLDIQMLPKWRLAHLFPHYKYRITESRGIKEKENQRQITPAISRS
jgi:hypothetical protein